MEAKMLEEKENVLIIQRQTLSGMHLGLKVSK